MAIANQSFVVDTAGPSSSLRHFPTVVQTKVFAAGTGTLAELTPVAYNTSTGFVVPWDADGTNDTDRIIGFIRNPSGVLLDASNQVQGLVTLAGRIHFDDIPIITGYVLADLQAACRSTAVRNLGFVIEGLSNFN